MVIHLTLVVMLTTLLFFLNILNLVADVLALRYFIAHRRTASALTYILICTNDIVTTVLCSIYTINFAFALAQIPLLAQSEALMLGVAMVWSVSRRLSNFLITTLLVTRTVTLFYHFRFIRRLHIGMPVGAYTLLLLTQAITIIGMSKCNPQPQLGICKVTPDTLEDNVRSVSGVKLILILYYQIEFILPLIFDVMLIFICFNVIKSGDRILGKIKHHIKHSTKSKVTRTAIIMSICHVALNTPFIIYILIFSSHIWTSINSPSRTPRSAVISNSNTSHDHQTEFMTHLVMDIMIPTALITGTLVVWYSRMSPLCVMLLRKRHRMRLYLVKFRGWLEYLFRENNRVVPYPPSPTVTLGTDSDIVQRNTAIGSSKTLRQIRSIELSELNSTETLWYDGIFSTDESSRYMNYLYETS